MKNTGSSPNYMSIITTGDSTQTNNWHIKKPNMTIIENNDLNADQEEKVELSASDWRKYHKKLASI